ELSMRLQGGSISPWYVQDKTAVTDGDGHFEFKHIAIPDPDIPFWTYFLGAADTDKLDLPKYRFNLYRGEETRTVNLNTLDRRAVISNNGLRTVTVTDLPTSTVREQVKLALLHGTVEVPTGLASSTELQIILIGADDYQAVAWVHGGAFKI